MKLKHIVFSLLAYITIVYETKAARCLKRFVVILVICLSAGNVSAQKKDSTNVGVARGLLRDSLHNYVMQAATISIYKAENGELMSYQLPDNSGRFQFIRLPVGILLRIIATNVGYAPAKREFMIPLKTKEIDLKTLNMDRLTVSLKEVTVSAPPPPIQMRGDTLEFNADAFNLDTNAVVGDMLRKLPGVTIWNDGVITVNGKKINKLLVEGKVFFGDGKIALQNLSKNAVKKIQVYQDKENPNPIEQKTNMNIVLKKDKKDGYFGKIGGSIGTLNRYDGNGMINYYSPKNQVSVVGVLNNVNKTAENVNTLISVNSFKEGGISNDYNSDFTKPGEIVFKAVGFSARHDFGYSRDSQPGMNQLKADYFLSQSNSEVDQNTHTDVSLGSNGHLSQTAISIAKTNYSGQSGNAAYSNVFDHNQLDVSYYFQYNTSNFLNIRTNTSAGNSAADQSQSYDEQANNNTNSIYGGDIKFTTHRYTDFGIHENKSLDMELSYSFNLNHTDGESRRVTNFSAIDSAQDKHFNRHYLTQSSASSHTIISSFNNIWGLLQSGTPYLQTDIKNALTLYDNKQNDVVSDLFNRGNQYTPNTNLSNRINNPVVNYKPGLNFYKEINNTLTDRFSKVWKFKVFAESQIYMQKYSSQKTFQNLGKSYFYFIPSSTLVFINNQLGEFKKTYLLTYNTTVTYPTFQQLAPLVDDANVYFLNYGNINLKPAYRHDLSFTYDYNNAEAENPLQGNLKIAVGQIDNFITDSSYYDALGRNIYYPINVSGNHYASLGGYLQKAFKHDDHQFQISGESRFNYAQYPSSLNGKYYETKTNSWLVTADVVYTYKGLLISELGGSFSGNRTSRADVSQYKYANWKTYANISLALPKSVFLSTRIDFNNSTSSNVNAIYYTIWNIDLGYRFLKGANGEVKISGLDLLHQNKNVINYVNNNSISTGTVNVLQQYFMVTLAYYPRRFGLSKSKN
ncbi:outer membrane beta-barrel protein [Mucilaginibacter sp. FT3.2]|uniref:outer membrane beta-barrel protein n=1 Tax=Mucilaginibacter sp. FT3.2 TaxID=2723090 RepID=UPI001621F82C|nr:outer membrane beta-barrel protein [Mucilaginibacter sp. FT3.2]MBB6232783.1 hypothetical protein [Mucilaginibacter sp. FT3.2]